MRHPAWAIALAFAIAAPANAAALPPNSALSFDVMRKGSVIGGHSYRFSGSASSFSVTVDTEISVPIPLDRSTLYSFKQHSTEQWRDGTFQKISSTTSEGGAPRQLDTSSKGALPASFWTEDTVHTGKLMNTADGKIMSVRVADLGTEDVDTRRGSINAHHYRLSGDLVRDLWFDGDGNLARAAFKADDGSTVTYVRK
ncbi:DUF6134 family protein [Seohaeicola zhoushanensis]|uniref:DUF3108 domain-containing protein n=1 Tax=Seohaeicola zhoushanensis TaxID=1569283 RepID=A0A8J3GY87_9RHOB|nr:DUF6134 family protein [Seohaeicola zhoushanensis]GHF57054.1 hypothetical protein GCM10017056_30610 [Seohaeicola zhoushanensis]